MIIDDLVIFYRQLLRRKILILASCDVDSLATVKILQHLFRLDCIYNILVPVLDYEQLKNAYTSLADSISCVLLVNCGGSIDILNFFGEDVPNDTLFYIIDHQRPLSVFNIYDSSRRVRIVTALQEEVFPEADEVFAEVSEDEDVDSEHELDLDEQIRFLQLKQRREKRLSAKIRRLERGRDAEQTILNYMQYTYFGNPAAFLMLHLALELGQATPEIIWWATVGITHCFHLRRIDRSDYCRYVAFLEGEVSRITSKNCNSKFDFKIKMVDDLDLILYKNWSIWESSNVTPNWILTFVLWTELGYRRLKLFFAESGLPHERMKMNYPYMSRYLKEKIEPSIRKHEQKYGFRDWLVGTFLARYGCLYAYTAMDIQMATMGILDANSHSKSLQDRFLDGLQCLEKEGVSTIKHGIQMTKRMLTLMYKQVRLGMMMELITAYSTVLVCKFAEKEFNFDYNTSVSYMRMFARFAQEAFILDHKVRKYRAMPFVVMIPIDAEYLMVIGECPLTYDSPRTQFRRIFDLVAQRMDEPGNVRFDQFDQCICRLKVEYRDEFIQKLIAVLTLSKKIP